MTIMIVLANAGDTIAILLPLWTTIEILSVILLSEICMLVFEGKNKYCIQTLFSVCV